MWERGGQRGGHSAASAGKQAGAKNCLHRWHAGIALRAASRAVGEGWRRLERSRTSGGLCSPRSALMSAVLRKRPLLSGSLGRAGRTQVLLRRAQMTRIRGSTTRAWPTSPAAALQRRL